DSARRQAAAPASVPGQPAAAAKFWPRVDASDSGGKVEVGELSYSARWNSPAASGEITLAPVSDAPADWPPNVTRSGSPPKESMLRCTQRNAAWMSRMP